MGGVHLPTASLVHIGSTATDGVEDMAEFGGTSTLLSEVQAMVTAGTALSGFSLSSPRTTTATSSGTVTVSATHNTITAMTMIAPSPDWFVAAISVGVVDDSGSFRDCVEVELVALDAGTDNGASYRSANADTSPREAVSMLYGSGNPIWSSTMRRGVIGTARFLRVGGAGIDACAPAVDLAGNTDDGDDGLSKAAMLGIAVPLALVVGVAVGLAVAKGVVALRNGRKQTSGGSKDTAAAASAVPV